MYIVPSTLKTQSVICAVSVVASVIHRSSQKTARSIKVRCVGMTVLVLVFSFSPLGPKSKMCRHDSVSTSVLILPTGPNFMKPVSTKICLAWNFFTDKTGLSPVHTSCECECNANLMWIWRHNPSFAAIFAWEFSTFFDNFFHNFIANLWRQHSYLNRIRRKYEPGFANQISMWFSG